jgi:glycosyltransferase involved in cell wall biosynthesis
MTQGMSLKKWDELGLLNREMAIYEKLMQDGFQVQIFSWGDVGDLYYESEYPNLKVLIIPYYQQNLTWKNRIHLFRAKQYLKNSHLIKTNQINGADVALAYSKKYNIPMITRCGYLLSQFTERQSQDESYIAHIKELERKVFVESDAGITSNPRDKDFVTQAYNLPADKVVCVPNYVDQKTFSPVFENRDEGHLLYIGRLSEQKNLFALLEAVAKSTVVNKLTIIGRGEQEKELQERADELSVPAEFLGAIPNKDLPGYLQRCTAYILPSHYEGLPKTLLEAMSCCCACIGTDVEGIREVLEDGVNGKLCDKDSESLQMAIEEVLTDEKMRKKLGRSAFETIKEIYGLEKVVEVEKVVYERVIGRNAENARKN